MNPNTVLDQRVSTILQNGFEDIIGHENVNEVYVHINRLSSYGVEMTDAVIIEEIVWLLEVSLFFNYCVGQA